MRKLLSVVSLGAVLGLFAPACSSGTSSSGGAGGAGAADDTCAFIADPNNCYRKLIAAVDDCLTDAGGDGGPSSSGTLSADGLSCTYASGRKVTFATDVRQSSSAKTPLDVTVALGGKTCVHYVSNPQTSITITQPDGATLEVVVGGSGETITCPDGSQHGIDVQKIFGGCGDGGGALSGGLPGTTTSGGGKTVSGGLIGQKKQAYSCTSP